jgi:hypothetical protein
MLFCGGYGGGPRFNPGLPVRDLTASSWRGLVVVPGGAPMPPECFTACEARGRRTPSRRHDASRERPFKWTRWSEFTRGFWGGDKSFRSVPIADALIYSDN